MRRIYLFLYAVVLGMGTAFAQYCADWQNVTCIVPSDQMAVFKSESASDSKKETAADAKRRLCFALFYKGVPGVNDGKPLIDNDNPMITAKFFNESNAFESYVISTEGGDKVRKMGDKYHAVYTLSVSMTLLTQFLQEQKLKTKISGFGEEGGPVMPTIMTIPFCKNGESFQAILENNPDMRVAVANVQDGFRSRNVTTFDFFAALRSNQRGTTYEENQGVAESNDRQLALSAGSDVYVEVDIIKDESPQGNKVTLILKAYETATATVLASKNVITRRYPNASIDVLTKYAVRDELQVFLDDICKKWTDPTGTEGEGTLVKMRFSLLDGGIITSFNDRVGTKNYPLSAVIRQWVRKNCHKAQFHQQVQNSELIIFDKITMPPTDADNFPMDAAQFAFLLESYLKETEGVDCSSLIEGNMIIFTIH